MSQMKRRSFLGLAGALSAVDPFGLGTALASEIVRAGSSPDWGAMAALGSRYLDRHPDEHAAASEMLARLGPFGQQDHQHLRKLIAAEMRRDLDSHDVVTVDGWVLPRTLVRVCSAIALAEASHVC
jgi:hypothetical protein